MKTTDNFIFFWNGIYSQWLPSLIEIEGKMFSCCEQYMMYKKAMLFGDTEAADQIMNTDNPAIQKEIGRRVKNFDREIWDANCYSIVYKANFAKFSQHKNLKRELILTGDKIIVEASPYDKIWGIAMGEDDPGIEDPANWKGLNLLGQCIMNVRSILKKL